MRREVRPLGARVVTALSLWTVDLWPRVVYGERETRTDGTHECVRPPEHPDEAHYWIKLNVGRRGA